MPWVPTTDFEEEVVNLQPHHDFIYGVLSEPQYSYPRPKSHTEYAANKKLRDKDQQKEYETTGKINEKLRIIQQVQRMANTKPVGEQPSLDDWDDNKTIEQETVGMMRYCGMGVSVEQPLEQKVTIATYPVQNTIKVVQNGRRKVALFFDDNVFKLQEKVSDNSYGFERCNNSESNRLENSHNDSLASGIENDASLNTCSSLSSVSFNTAAVPSDSFSSVSSCIKSASKHLTEQRLPQYEKLVEDISSLSLDSCKTCDSNSSIKPNSDSFKTAKDGSFWKPVFEDENIFSKKENWPVLAKDTACDKNSLDASDLFNKTDSDSNDDDSGESNNSKNKIRENFLHRFIQSKDGGKANITVNSTSPPKPPTYASIAKTPKVQLQAPKQEKKSSNLTRDFPFFYTPKKMYALKRNVK